MSFLTSSFLQHKESFDITILSVMKYACCVDLVIINDLGSHVHSLYHCRLVRSFSLSHTCELLTATHLLKLYMTDFFFI